jgi:hypothetical protein
MKKTENKEFYTVHFNVQKPFLKKQKKGNVIYINFNDYQIIDRFSTF